MDVCGDEIGKNLDLHTSPVRKVGVSKSLMEVLRDGQLKLSKLPPVSKRKSVNIKSKSKSKVAPGKSTQDQDIRLLFSASQSQKDNSCMRGKVKIKGKVLNKIQDLSNESPGTNSGV